MLISDGNYSKKPTIYMLTSSNDEDWVTIYAKYRPAFNYTGLSATQSVMQIYGVVGEDQGMFMNIAVLKYDLREGI